MVYLAAANPWGSTNYLVNWNVFSNGSASLGYTAPTQRLSAIKDGAANTIMFAEGYSWCENRGRTALLTWHNGSGGLNYGGVHNFGLTYGLSNNQIMVNGSSGSVSVKNPNGFPNPSADPDLNFYFQIRPLPKAPSACPPGADCCDSMTAQTGHSALNVALADGSVRSVTKGVSPNTWRQAMLPRDGEAMGADW
jgi:hypothetical protein